MCSGFSEPHTSVKFSSHEDILGLTPTAGSPDPVLPETQSQGELTKDQGKSRFQKLHKMNGKIA